jgi:hypothetical protein
MELLNLSAKELASAWADLAGTGAATAQLAIEALVLSWRPCRFYRLRMLCKRWRRSGWWNQSAYQ